MGHSTDKEGGIHCSVFGRRSVVVVVLLFLFLLSLDFYQANDKARTGFLAAVQARNILLQTGLSQQTLATIWNTSDIDKVFRQLLDFFINKIENIIHRFKVSLNRLVNSNILNAFLGP